ncbi:hypothetical protein Tco_0934299 [Tanacetum coccineum]
MTLEEAQEQMIQLKRIADVKAAEEKSKRSLEKINIEAQKAKLAEYEAKREKMLAEYNHYINFKAHPGRITKINYKIDKVTRDVTMRIERDNQPLGLTVMEKFGLKQLGFTEWIEVQALASKGKSKAADTLLKKGGLTPAERKRKRTSNIIKEVFVTKDIRVEGMQRNLIPPPGVMPIQGLVISELESGIFFMNRNTDIGFQRESEFHLAPTIDLIRLQRQIKVDSEIAREMVSRMNFVIEARDDYNKAREAVEKNLETLGCIPAECKASEGNEEQLSAKHQLIIKGLADGKASTSNLRDIQIKDIVKEVEDHLKTYSPAEMDIRDAFHQLFEEDERTFRSVLSRNIQNLERQLNKEILHEKDSNFDLRVIKVQFDKFIHSKVLEPSNYNSYDLETRRDFKDYTHMEAKTFKETIIQNMNSIEQCIVERTNHEQELQNGLKSKIVSDKENDQGLKNQSNTSGDESSRSRNECNDKSTSGDDTGIRPSYDTEPMVEVPYTAEYNVFAVDTQHSEQSESIINTYVMETGNSNVIPDSPDMCDNDIQNDQNVVECEDERVALANLISNLKLDIDENKKIQKQLKKANASLTQELTECKFILTETSSTLGESNSVRDSCLVALQNKQTEFERYKAFNDRTVDYDKLEHKLNKTLGLLAQIEIGIKEGLKVKAYEILVVKEKHDELVKQSLLTKSHYEGFVKEKQRSQSIQTIHMLAPKCPTFNGRPTFANPMYLKNGQNKKSFLYEIPHDQSDPANRLVPDREEILTLEEENRSKLNKDLIIFVPPTAKDMEILIKTCLMPLALKTQNDSFAFVHELKKEMHADLKYVESLENDIDELEFEKAEFSNIYDMLLQ